MSDSTPAQCKSRSPDHQRQLTWIRNSGRILYGNKVWKLLYVTLLDLEVRAHSWLFQTNTAIVVLCSNNSLSRMSSVSLILCSSSQDSGSYVGTFTTGDEPLLLGQDAAWWEDGSQGWSESQWESYERYLGISREMTRIIAQVSPVLPNL